MLKVGIIGCGVIGSELARAIRYRFSKIAKVSCLCDRSPAAIENLEKKLKLSCRVVSMKELVRSSDFIIEAASQSAVAEVIPLILKFKKPIMILSVGGLLKSPKLSLLQSKGLLYVPSGAVGGVDALLAAREGKVKSVTITTRKPLNNVKDAPFFKNSPWRYRNIKKPTLIFEGNAKSAISFFPQNINVAATLSLAGIGPERTRVRMVVSPTFKRNSHEIVFEGDFGRVRTLAENVPSKSNPKTSMLVVYSTIACLRKIFSSFKIGT